MEDYKFDSEYKRDTQLKFLSLLIFDQTWAKLDGYDLIKPEYFEDRLLSKICKCMHEYFDRYKTIPTYAVLDEMLKEYIENFGGKVEEYYSYRKALDSIFELSESTDLAFYKERAITFVKQISWKKALAVGSKVLATPGNFEEAVTEFRKVLSMGISEDLGLDFEKTTTEQFLGLLGESYDRDRMLSTGVASWDRALGGGFVSKNVHIIGAPPGGGKSRIMSYLTRVALQRLKKVIFITLELSETETLANIYTSATGVGIHEMLDRKNRDEFEQKAMLFKNRYSQDLLVKFFKPGAITTDTIHNYIQKVIQQKESEKGTEWKPDVIFIDYMDKLLPTHKLRGNTYEDGGGIATDCKNLGITFDCPVITGSQLGRYCWVLQGDAVVSMDSIAESAQKVHIAHSMTTVNSNKAEKENSKTRLFLAKSRSGNPGQVVWCTNDLGKCNVMEIEPWDPVSMTGTQTYSIKDSSSRK